MAQKKRLIFINYSPEDNKAQDAPGWVESFSYVLKVLCSQIIGNAIEIKLREDLKNGELPDDEIEENDVFINIYSEFFDKDEVARKNWEKFNAKGQSSQTFMVLRNELMDNSFGDKLYEFYSDNESWNPELESEHSREYWLKAVDLAYDISKSLKKEESAKGKSVYLAETIAEQKNIRNAIKRDLNRHGYRVLPDKPLPLSKDLIEKEIIRNIEQADMSIHILGDKYGDKKVLQNTSIVDYQNKIASKFCLENPSKLKRIIWLSPDHKNTDLEQSEYLEQLRKNKDQLASAELIQTPVELLKSIVLEKLSNGKSKSFSKTKSKTKLPEQIEEGGVYLIHDIADGDDVKPLRAWLEKNDLKVITPDFELEHYNLMIDHKQKMVKSDSVLIYCNKGNIQWSKTKIKDIIKAPGFGRKRKFNFKCLYIASAKNKDLKDQVDDSDFIIIENDDKFSASMMNPLLKK